MSDPDLVIYHYPGACSQVSVCALEMAGVDYRLELVDLGRDGQREAAYLAISPLGKVPMLLIDGQPLAENAAILTYIATLRPEAGIFPSNPDPRMCAEIVGGMSFCGGTLHPQVRGLANPQRLTAGDIEPVRQKSTELAKKSFAYAERRLSQRRWWLGPESIIDVYLNWAFGVVRRIGFDVEPFPLLDSLPERLAERPAFAAMLRGEASSRSALGL